MQSKMEAGRSFALHVLFVKDGASWVAQCLEYDLCAQAKTIGELKTRFVYTIVAQIMSDVKKGREPFAQVPQAPKSFWDIWERAEPLADKSVPIRMPDVAASGKKPTHAQQPRACVVEEMRVA